MKRDVLILLAMILLTATFSAYGHAENIGTQDDLAMELEAESRGLNFQKEIAKQEGQFRVVAKAIKGEDTGSEPSLDSDNDPLTVTLIKAR